MYSILASHALRARAARAARVPRAIRSARPRLRAFSLGSLGAALLGAALLGACTDSEPDLPRLEFPDSMPSELAVGDTTGALTMVRYFANSQGQQMTTDPYLGFVFTSSDTTVVKVVESRRLLGVAPGTAEISASDGAGSDTKKPATVTVRAE